MLPSLGSYRSWHITPKGRNFVISCEYKYCTVCDIYGIIFVPQLLQKGLQK